VTEKDEGNEDPTIDRASKEHANLFLAHVVLWFGVILFVLGVVGWVLNVSGISGLAVGTALFLVGWILVFRSKRKKAP
jgi:high-affinity Fe2+/Pb2+ permease